MGVFNIQIKPTRSRIERGWVMGNRSPGGRAVSRLSAPRRKGVDSDASERAFDAQH